MTREQAKALKKGDKVLLQADEGEEVDGIVRRLVGQVVTITFIDNDGDAYIEEEEGEIVLSYEMQLLTFSLEDAANIYSQLAKILSL